MLLDDARNTAWWVRRLGAAAMLAALAFSLGGAAARDAPPETPSTEDMAAAGSGHGHYGPNTARRLSPQIDRIIRVAAQRNKGEEEKKGSSGGTQLKSAPVQKKTAPPAKKQAPAVKKKAPPPKKKKVTPTRKKAPVLKKAPPKKTAPPKTKAPPPKKAAPKKTVPPPQKEVPAKKAPPPKTETPPAKKAVPAPAPKPGPSDEQLQENESFCAQNPNSPSCNKGTEPSAETAPSEPAPATEKICSANPKYPGCDKLNQQPDLGGAGADEGRVGSVCEQNPQLPQCREAGEAAGPGGPDGQPEDEKPRPRPDGDGPPDLTPPPIPAPLPPAPPPSGEAEPAGPTIQTVTECPEGQGRLSDGGCGPCPAWQGIREDGACGICPEGNSEYAAIGSDGSCLAACPENTVRAGDDCVPRQGECPAGELQRETNDGVVCIDREDCSDDPSMVESDGRCIAPCGEGQEYIEGLCLAACAAGEERGPDRQCALPACSGQVALPDGSCVESCPPGMSAQNGQCQSDCGPNLLPIDGTCQTLDEVDYDDFIELCEDSIRAGVSLSVNSFFGYDYSGNSRERQCELLVDLTCTTGTLSESDAPLCADRERVCDEDEMIAVDGSCTEACEEGQYVIAGAQCGTQCNPPYSVLGNECRRGCPEGYDLVLGGEGGQHQCVSSAAPAPADEDEASPPEDGTPSPSDETVPPPEEGTPPPAEDTSPTDDQTPPPSDETAPPPEDGAPPAAEEETTPPADEVPPPAHGAPPPAGKTPPPLDEAAPPSPSGPPPPSGGALPAPPAPAGEAKPVAPAPKGDAGAESKWGLPVAVVIAIDDYDDKALAGSPRAIANAAHLVRFLKGDLGMDDTSIVTGRNATGSQFEEIFGKAGSGNSSDGKSELRDLINAKMPSEVIVYFAGQARALDGGADVLLLPADADPAKPETGIKLSALYDRLAAMGIERLRVYIDPSFIKDEDVVEIEAGPRIGLFGLFTPPHWVTLSAASDTSEVGDAQRQRSLFIESLVAGLRGIADTTGEGDGDGTVSAKELHEFTRDQAAAAAKRGAKVPMPSLYGKPSETLRTY